MASIERALAKIRKGGASQPLHQPALRQGKQRAGARQGASDPNATLAKLTQRNVEFDLQSFSESGLISNDNHKLSDEYRLIKQPILKKASKITQDERGFENLLMVTSSLASEGKTFTSVNLSLSLAAERDWEVLLVDTDCRNPQLSRQLGVDDEPGLLDILKDPSLNAESLILGTNIDGLSVLPVGHRVGNSPELLASNRMAELCREFSSYANGRVITVFDSSPLLLTSESPILSSFVGQIVMVVRANSTPRQAMEQALEKLDPTAAIGLVLNGADASEDVLSYGNYHAYGAVHA